MTPPSELCLDANVFVAAADINETSNREAVSLLQTIEKRQTVLYEPALVLFEVASAFYRKQRAGALSPKEVGDRLAMLFEFPILLKWQSTIVESARGYAADLAAATLYDYTYLAVAQSRGIPLVTLDRQLLESGRQIYPDIFTPQEFIDILA